MSRKSKKKQELEQALGQSVTEEVQQEQQATETPTEEIKIESSSKEEQMPPAFDEYENATKRPRSIKLPEEEKEKPVPVQKSGPSMDPVDFARRNVKDYSPSWEGSIRAFQKHLGLADKLSEEDCVAFLKRWGAKLD